MVATGTIFAFATGASLITPEGPTVGELVGCNKGVPDGVDAGCTEGLFVAETGAVDVFAEGFDVLGALDGVPTGWIVFAEVGAIDGEFVGLLGRCVEGEAVGDIIGNPVELPKFNGSLQRREEGKG